MQVNMSSIDYMCPDTEHLIMRRYIHKILDGQDVVGIRGCLSLWLTYHEQHLVFVLAGSKSGAPGATKWQFAEDLGISEYPRQILQQMTEWEKNVGSG
jgi:hypothetical protein